MILDMSPKLSFGLTNVEWTADTGHQINDAYSIAVHKVSRFKFNLNSHDNAVWPHCNCDLCSHIWYSRLGCTRCCFLVALSLLRHFRLCTSDSGRHPNTPVNYGCTRAKVNLSILHLWQPFIWQGRHFATLDASVRGRRGQPGGRGHLWGPPWPHKWQGDPCGVYIHCLIWLFGLPLIQSRVESLNCQRLSLRSVFIRILNYFNLRLLSVTFYAQFDHQLVGFWAIRFKLHLPCIISTLSILST